MAWTGILWKPTKLGIELEKIVCACKARRGPLPLDSFKWRLPLNKLTVALLCLAMECLVQQQKPWAVFDKFDANRATAVLRDSKSDAPFLDFDYKRSNKTEIFTAIRWLNNIPIEKSVLKFESSGCKFESHDLIKQTTTETRQSSWSDASYVKLILLKMLYRSEGLSHMASKRFRNVLDSPYSNPKLASNGNAIVFKDGSRVDFIVGASEIVAKYEANQVFHRSDS